MVLLKNANLLSLYIRDVYMIVITLSYSKPCLKWPLKKHQNVFKTDYCITQITCNAECSKRAFCKTFDLHQAYICL